MPLIPLVDVVDKTGTVPPVHIERVEAKSKTGIMLDVTVTVNVVGIAHCPAVGVKVYTPEFWLLTTAGFQVPLIPLVDVIGNTGAVAPAQIVKLVPKLNVGVRIGLTVTVNVDTVAHKPAVGVKV